MRIQRDNNYADAYLAKQSTVPSEIIDGKQEIRFFPIPAKSARIKNTLTQAYLLNQNDEYTMTDDERMTKSE